MITVLIVLEGRRHVVAGDVPEGLGRGPSVRSNGVGMIDEITSSRGCSRYQWWLLWLFLLWLWPNRRLK